MLEPSTSSSSTTLVGSRARPRSPAVQNSAPRSVLADGTIGIGDPVAVSARTPLPREARNRAPVFNSWTTPNDTSPSRASSDGGTTPTDTQHDSRPAAAGTGAVDRVDHEEGARPAVDDEPAVFGIEADVARGLESLLQHPLGDLVDVQRRVAARGAPDARGRRRCRAVGRRRRGSRPPPTPPARPSPPVGASGLTRPGAARRGRRSSARRSR